jgi:hypothetical protein
MADKRNALLIATGEYVDPKLPSLVGPTVDVRELGRVLSDASIGGFEVDVVENAGVQDLRIRLDEFFANRTQRDLLVLHFSCHGIKDDWGRLYFAAADTHLNRLVSTGIEDRWVQQLIDGSRSQRIVLLLDCCFGGAFANSMARRAPGSEQVGIKERFDGKGRLVLTASTATQYAFEAGELYGEPQPSIFTRAIVRGLETGDADRDGDGKVSIDELYDFAVDALREQDASQTPTKAGYVEGDLFLAVSPRGPRSSPDVRTGVRQSVDPLSPYALRSGATLRRRARRRVVHEHDTLESIAYDEYGDPTLWRALAIVNDIDDPLQLAIDSTLDVPALPEAKAHA